MRRRGGAGGSNDLRGLVQAAQVAWKNEAQARDAHLEAVAAALEGARRLVNEVLTADGYLQAENKSGFGWVQPGFWTRIVPARRELYVDIVGRPDFVAVSSPAQVLQAWMRLMTRHGIQAPEFLIYQENDGSPTNNPYLRIVLNYCA